MLVELVNVMLHVTQFLSSHEESQGEPFFTMSLQISNQGFSMVFNLQICQMTVIISAYV
jgi:hypothetical protein